MSSFIARIRRWLGLAPKETPVIVISYAVQPGAAASREALARWRLAVANMRLRQAADQFARVVLEALDG